MPIFQQFRRWKQIEEESLPHKQAMSKEYTANFFSRLTFQWIQPLISLAYCRPLELNDIWLVNPNRTVEVMSEEFNKSFRLYIKRNDTQPLLRALYSCFKAEFWIGGLCQFTSIILLATSPFILRYIIDFASHAYEAQRTKSKSPSIGEGIAYVLTITAMQVFQSLATNHVLYRGMMVGGQTRAVLIAAIFDKALKTPGRVRPSHFGAHSGRMLATGSNVRARSTKIQNGPEPHDAGWSNGRVVNLMSTDTARIDQAISVIHLVWALPLSIFITLGFLIVNIQYAALSGFALLALCTLLMTIVMKSLISLRARIITITDQRVALTMDILRSIRFVKVFAWERSFLGQIHEIRTRELGNIKRLLTIRNGVLACSASLPTFAAVLSFATYTLSKHTLKPGPAFSSLALFNALRFPLNLLPIVLGQAGDAVSSIRRVQSFLMSEEQLDPVKWKPGCEEAVIVQHANFDWGCDGVEEPDPRSSMEEAIAPPHTAESDSVKLAKGQNDIKMKSLTPGTMAGQPGTFQLQQINLSIGKGELVAVIGSVGSGKSSLLSAFAGEMFKTSGQIFMGGKRAFCPQDAWIKNDSIRENVLFGKFMNKSWYQSVIDACALQVDLNLFPAQDLTEIGERGITLSGGQKARLSLARAVYSKSDIILMDDPLSAIDAHTRKHVLEEVICGLLKDKCRILATNQLHVLHRCDRVIWMQNGFIRSIDTFQNLMAYSIDFQKMMAQPPQTLRGPATGILGEDFAQEKSARSGGLRQINAKDLPLMQQEERSARSVKWHSYAEYIRASGTYWSVPIILGLLVLAQGTGVVSGLWLTFWTSDRFNYSHSQYAGVYTSFGAMQAFLAFFTGAAVSTFGVKSSKSTFQKAIIGVFGAPMSFFDTTPLGRIANRLTSDIDILDNTISDSIRLFLATIASIGSIFILIISVFHYFVIPLTVVAVGFLLLAQYYRASARDLKRHEAVLRSSVFVGFSAAVWGSSTIRAYNRQDYFNNSLREFLDQMDSALFLNFANQRWLSVRADAMGNFLILITGIFVVTNCFQVSPSVSGLVLTYIISITQILQLLVRQLAEVESCMTAVERVQYYGSHPQKEASSSTLQVSAQWPNKGRIVFENVQMRYRAGTPLILRGVSFSVRAEERFGIIGRTGAGKSSLISTICRLVDLSAGTVSIDGVDISQVSLHDLRSRLTVIPQDPTLFRGTIRSNLDPFNEHTDAELRSALEQANIACFSASPGQDRSGASSHSFDLGSPVGSEGANFSSGQRQLLALARALARKSRIILCDEATSSLDDQTDRRIQRAISAAFKGCTLVCIAHRLKTVIHFDRICVMDEGVVAELDTPLRLWHFGGLFRSMCDKSGITEEDFFARGDST
jgi:ATP-binding cassette, subfamily C (CFTR/MRP), member 1